MRRLAWVLLGTVACGGNNSAKDDASTTGDGARDAPIDAPTLPACASPTNGTTISARLIGSINEGGESDAALLATAPPGDPRLFVVGRSGKIHIFENEQKRATPFIDLSPDNTGPVVSGNELGLLGLAFHPQYFQNRTFFVYYTRNEPGDTTYELRDVVARCQANAADPNTADPASCIEILQIRDTFSNHNGGMIEFGPDGMLYIGTGDGGSGGDPHGNAQTLTDGTPNALSVALLGKLLRIDVDNKDLGKEYGVPGDNPFLGSGAPEVYALGLRNPWRFPFDAVTGDIWIGDVGQGPNPVGTEEINFVKAGELAGKNFGWKMWEGHTCFSGPCSETGMTFAVNERSGGNPDNFHAIVGGQVYRGTCYPDIVGTYFYSDNTAGGLYSGKMEANGTFTTSELTPPAGQSYPTGPSSIHADARGELYITRGTNGGGGQVFHIEAGP
jgi:glucose/arabinose dehydrogenase